MPSDTLKWIQGYNVKKEYIWSNILFFFDCSMTNCIIGLIKRWSVSYLIHNSQNVTKAVELMVLHKIVNISAFVLSMTSKQC